MNFPFTLRLWIIQGKRRSHWNRRKVCSAISVEKQFSNELKMTKKLLCAMIFEVDRCLRDISTKCNSSSNEREPRDEMLQFSASQVSTSIAFSWSQYWSKIVFAGNNGTRNVSWMELPFWEFLRNISRPAMILRRLINVLGRQTRVLSMFKVKVIEDCRAKSNFFYGNHE